MGSFLLSLGLFTRTVAFVLAGDMAVAYFMARSPRGFFPLLNGGEFGDRLLLRVPLFSGSPAAANEASIDCARPHPHPPYRRAGPKGFASDPVLMHDPGRLYRPMGRFAQPLSILFAKVHRLACMAA